jgi:hypothetical protein
MISICIAEGYSAQALTAAGIAFNFLMPCMQFRLPGINCPVNMFTAGGCEILQEKGN